MGKFFFDVREGTTFAVDTEGSEHANLEAAEQEAAEAAAEISRNRLPNLDVRRIVVEVRNEHGQRVITATVSMEIERVESSPTVPPAND
jgi:hypothetical protein